MIDDLLDLVSTKMCDFLKDGQTYTKTSLLETLGSAIRYVKTFAYGLEFNETEKIGAREKKLKALRIIKEKNINVRGIINSPNLEYYIDHCMPRHSGEPTQEEYEIVKEVLL